MQPFVYLCAALGIAACHHTSEPPPPPPPPPPNINPVTIPAPSILDPMAYLAQTQDGKPLTATDVMTYRRTDFGNYQVSDSFLQDQTHAITTWSYYPFGDYVPSHGDGGEQYALEFGSQVRITSTKDGSSPVATEFTGPDGWIVFRTDATADPKCLIAAIGTAKAYTCYWRQTVNYPSLGPIDSIISEHYDAADPGNSTSMERFFLGRGYGRLVWQAMGRPSPMTPADLMVQRCPNFDGFNRPPYLNWQLNDCRESVNVIPPPSPITGAQEWHP